MQIILEIVSGPAMGGSFRLLEGEYVRIGRTDQADYVVAGDGHMSSLHFLVECRPTEVRLRDLKSTNGTMVNGVCVIETELKDGDQIAAGQSVFRMRVEQAASVAETAGESLAPGGADFLLARLRGQFQPLYALVDAARDAKIYALLLQSSEERQSLYEGAQGDKLALFAPYLVRVPAVSGLLETFVRQGWGKSWGVYLTCPASFADVRQHFRHFLKVKKPDGKVVYFRYYDPRVLRIYLPTCTEQETEIFFGPIARFVAEDESPAVMLEFTRRRGGVQKTVWRLAAAAAEPSAKPAAVTDTEKAALAAQSGDTQKTIFSGRGE